MRILFVAPECAPYAKAGGLGDVVGALPKALLRRGHDVRVLLPLYGHVDRETLWRHGAPLGVPLGGGEAWCAVYESRLPGSEVPVYFLEHEALFGAPYIYGSEDLHEFARFALLSRAAFQLCRYLDFVPDAFHMHDWPTGPVAALCRFVERWPPFAQVGTVFTMHNVAHQPRFAPEGLGLLHLGPEAFHSDGFEDFGLLNPFKAGAVFADVMTTVSPTYAWEIQTHEGGAGLHDLMRERSPELMGILNGIDVDVWDPSTDRYLPARYSVRDLSGKQICKAALRSELGFLASDTAVPLIGLVARLTLQKGIDLLLGALDGIMETGAELVVLGTGDPMLEDALRSAAARYPSRARVIIGYNEGLAHRIEAGCDMFLMPSRFEPCGLNQLYSQRYGTPPIVRRVGGLADSVENYGSVSHGLGTGFVFDGLSVDALLDAVRRAVRLYWDEPAVFRAMQQAGMRKDFSWSRAATGYEEAYDRARIRRRSRASAA
ncbi:MAG: glycogen synthase [Myxococcota bacterium]